MAGMSLLILICPTPGLARKWGRAYWTHRHAIKKTAPDAKHLGLSSFFLAEERLIFTLTLPDQAGGSFPSFHRYSFGEVPT